MDLTDGEIFCEDDFMSASFAAFEAMRRNAELVDVKIPLEDHTVFGHRLILAARIPYFRQIYCSSEEEVILEDAHPSALELVFDFAYNGKIKITPGNVISLLSTSKVLRLTRVYNACWKFLKSRLDVDNVLQIRGLAEKHCHEEFLKVADNYIRENFEEFSQSDSFLTLPFQQLKEVISRDDIKVTKEEKVFEAVIKWIKVSPRKRSDMLPELLSAVRMYFLTPDYVIERVCTEKLVRSSVRCRNMVEEAKSYHLLPHKRSNFCLLPSQPRLYSTKSLDTALMPQPLYNNNTRHISTSSDDPGRNFLYSFYNSVDGTLNVKRFNPEDETWLELPSYDSDQIIEEVASLDGIIYIFSTFSLQTFNVNTCEWNSSKYSYNAWGSGILPYRGKIYFLGGYISSSREFWSFNPRQKEWKHEGYMTREVIKPGVTVVIISKGASLETSFYITGGFYERYVYNNVERFDPDTKQWTSVLSMLWGRYDHGCCNLNEKIYVCGGMGNMRKLLKSAEVYDPLTNRWSLISSMQHLDGCISMTSYQDKLYVCRGEVLFTKMESNMEIYDPKNNEWKSGTPTRAEYTRGRTLIVKSLCSRL